MAKQLKQCPDVARGVCLWWGLEVLPLGPSVEEARHLFNTFGGPSLASWGGSVEPFGHSVSPTLA